VTTHLAERTGSVTGLTARDLAAFAAAVARADDLRAARHTVVDRAARLLDTPWVGLTRHGPPREISFVANSHEVVRTVGRIVTDLREGPCWQLYADGAPAVACPDLGREDRWPGFRRALAQLPIRSALAVALRFDGTSDGSLLLYSDVPGHFDGRRTADAALVAEQAAIGLAHVGYRTKAENLEIALRTSREIAIAIGIVMDRFRVTEDAAFAVLREVSQDRHVKVRELATRIVLTGQVPGGVSEATA
jgi:GAF domain-containing protein